MTWKVVCGLFLLFSGAIAITSRLVFPADLVACFMFGFGISFINWAYDDLKDLLEASK